MKTCELQEAALDWAVEKCEFARLAQNGFPVAPWVEQLHAEGDLSTYPSRDWAQGGPIVERERIELRGDGDEGWIAYDNLNPAQKGTTPLVAAMRCYVASKLGDEVEVPDELLQGEQA